MDNKKDIIKLTLFLAAALFFCISTFSLLANENGYNLTKILLNFTFNIPMILIIGYVDYKVISFRQMKKSNYGIGKSLILDFILTTLFVGVLTILLHIVLFHNMNLRNGLLTSILLNGFIVLFIELFLYNKRQTENEIKLNLMEKEKAVYQFEALKNQINPHFLFNSLNVLSSLAYQDAEKTNLFAKKLSNVYRYLLTTHEQPYVTLEEELLFVDSYLFLEQIRFGETLKVIIDNDGKNQQKAVIPASLQMLVENAIKHNISTVKSPLIIRITVNGDGITVSNNLQLRSYVIKNGMGLNNLKKQYSLHNQEINIITTDMNFIVKLPFIEQ